jgi:hypothetical protein
MTVDTGKTTVLQSRLLVFGPRFKEEYPDLETHMVTTPPRILVPEYGFNAATSDTFPEKNSQILWLKENDEKR